MSETMQDDWTTTEENAAPDPDSDVESDTDTDSDPGMETESETETETETDTDSDPDPDSDIDPVSAADSDDSDSDSDMGSEPDPDPDTGSQAGSGPDQDGDSGSDPDAEATTAGVLFPFRWLSGESERDRIVRCCEEALADGPMGQFDRHDFYREYISCFQEETPEAAERLTRVRTSCAMFVRATLHHCGFPGQGPYRPGTPMFTSMGNVGFRHPSFVPNNGVNTPEPGDYFYISNTSTDGHTGIFIEDLGDSQWRTAEGGGGHNDGTLCRFSTRKISGAHFHNDGRKLHGWFDCTRIGLFG